MVVRDIYHERVFGRRGRLPEAAGRHGLEPSLDPGLQPSEGPGHRRIREDALDGIYVMAFSLLASTGTAGALLLLTRLAG
jgi:hypothetical protein